MEKYHLKNVIVDHAKFYRPSSICLSDRDRYRLNGRECQISTDTTGNMFVIAFTVRDQFECRTVSCRQQSFTNAYSNIETSSRHISLPITFTNGQTRDVDLILCSFGSSHNGK